MSSNDHDVISNEQITRVKTELQNKHHALPEQLRETLRLLTIAMQRRNDPAHTESFIQKAKRLLQRCLSKENKRDLVAQHQESFVRELAHTIRILQTRDLDAPRMARIKLANLLKSHARTGQELFVKSTGDHDVASLTIPDADVEDRFSRITLPNAEAMLYWLNNLTATRFTDLLRYATITCPPARLYNRLWALMDEEIMTDAQERILAQAIVRNLDKIGGVATVLDFAIESIYPDLLNALITGGTIPTLSRLDDIREWYRRSCNGMRNRSHIRLESFLPLVFMAQQEQETCLPLMTHFLHHSLASGHTDLSCALLRCLQRDDLIVSVATNLVTTHWSELSQAPAMLQQLWRILPFGHRDAFRLSFRTHLQEAPDLPKRINDLLTHPALVSLLSEAVARLLFRETNTDSSEPMPAPTSWQTVFDAVPASDTAVLNRVIYHYRDRLVTGTNLASLLAQREPKQRLNELETLYWKGEACFTHLGQNKTDLVNVLTLLSREQRVRFLMHKGHHIAPDLWPTVLPIVDESDISSLLNNTLRYGNNAVFVHIMKALPNDAFWLNWQTLSDRERHTLMTQPEHLSILLHHIPVDKQEAVREQLFSRLINHPDKTFHIHPWLQNESYFSALLPAAHQWLRDASITANLPFEQRLSVPGTQRTELSAFLDAIPARERRALIPSLLNDADIIKDLLRRYPESERLDGILCVSRSFFVTNWTDKMPLLIAILEELPEHDRGIFINRLVVGLPQQAWRPASYRELQHAHALFNEPMLHFLQRVGLNNHPAVQGTQLPDDAINAQDALGTTALMHAYRHGQMDMARHLADQPDCDPGIRNVYGETAFTCAAATQSIAAIAHLIQTGQYQPNAHDALTALYFTLNHANNIMLTFLFTHFFPMITWPQTEPVFDDSVFSNTLRWQYKSTGLLRSYYALASLPYALAHNELTRLALSPGQTDIFRYQMQALQMAPAHAPNLTRLLNALTGKALRILTLSDFHIDRDDDVASLVRFLDDNSQLQELNLGTLHLHPENVRMISDALHRHPEIRRSRLTCHVFSRQNRDEPDTLFSCSGQRVVSVFRSKTECTFEFAHTPTPEKRSDRNRFFVAGGATTPGETQTAGFMLR